MTIKALLVATLALPLAAAPALAAQQEEEEEGTNPSRACSSMSDAIFGSPLTRGGCTSYVAKGEITGAGYSAQCKNLTRKLGGYPFTFYEPEPLPTTEAKNHGECVNALRFLHTTYGG